MECKIATIQLNSNLQGMAQLYGPVYYFAFCERLTISPSSFYFLPEISTRAIFHDDAEAIAVLEARFVRENI